MFGVEFKTPKVNKIVIQAHFKQTGPAVSFQPSLPVSLESITRHDGLWPCWDTLGRLTECGRSLDTSRKTPSSV